MSSKKGRIARRQARATHIANANHREAHRQWSENTALLAKMRSAPETLTAQEISKLSKCARQEHIDLMTRALTQYETQNVVRQN